MSDRQNCERLLTGFKIFAMLHLNLGNLPIVQFPTTKTSHHREQQDPLYSTDQYLTLLCQLSRKLVCFWHPGGKTVNPGNGITLQSSVHWLAINFWMRNDLLHSCTTFFFFCSFVTKLKCFQRFLFFVKIDKSDNCGHSWQQVWQPSATCVTVWVHFHDWYMLAGCSRYIVWSDPRSQILCGQTIGDKNISRKIFARVVFALAFVSSV